METASTVVCGALFVIWIFITLVVNIIFSMEEVDEFERNGKILPVAFYPQIYIWNELSEKINKVGIIIAEIFAFPFFIVNNIFMLIFFTCEKICVWLWQKYIWIFRRRDNNE